MSENHVLGRQYVGVWNLVDWASIWVESLSQIDEFETNSLSKLGVRDDRGIGRRRSADELLHCPLGADNPFKAIASQPRCSFVGRTLVTARDVIDRSKDSCVQVERVVLAVAIVERAVLVH